MFVTGFASFGSGISRAGPADYPWVSWLYRSITVLAAWLSALFFGLAELWAG